MSLHECVTPIGQRQRPTFDTDRLDRVCSSCRGRGWVSLIGPGPSKFSAPVDCIFCREQPLQDEHVWARALLENPQ